MPTAFPVPRSLEVKSGGKSTVEKLFGTTEDSIAVTEVAASGAIDPKKGKKGPFTLAAAGTLQGTPAGRFIVVGTSQWAENRAMGSRTLGNRDLFMNMINWLSAGRRPDQHPSQIHRGSAPHPDHPEAQPGLLAERRHLPPRHRRLRPGHLVEEEISHEAEGTPDCRRSFGCSGRADLVE